MQRVKGDVLAVATFSYVLFCCISEANVLEESLDLVTALVLSSVFVIIDVCFIKSCTSASCFNQSLKLRSVGFTHCFWTVKIDHDSIIMGGNFCIAVLSS